MLLPDLILKCLDMLLYLHLHLFNWIQLDRLWFEGPLFESLNHFLRIAPPVDEVKVGHSLVVWVLLSLLEATLLCYGISDAPGVDLPVLVALVGV